MNNVRRETASLKVWALQDFVLEFIAEEGGKYSK